MLDTIVCKRCGHIQQIPIEAMGQRVLPTTNDVLNTQTVQEDPYVVMLRRFLTEKCQIAPELWTSITDIHHRFVLFAAMQGLEPPPTIIRTAKMLSGVAQSKKVGGQRGYVGIGILRAKRPE